VIGEEGFYLTLYKAEGITYFLKGSYHPDDSNLGIEVKIE